VARYYVGGTGNWNDTAHWATASGGASGAAVPTNADDVIFDSLSGLGTATINVNAACRSLKSTLSSILTLSHAAAVTLSIGDGTAGAGNVALDLSGFTTYTLGNATTSAISFVSTSAMVQSITWGSKTPGNVTFDGSGGSWQVQDAWTAALTAVTLTRGTLDTNGQTCSFNSLVSSNTNTRTFTPGSSAIALSGTLPMDFAGTNLTVTANTAVITCSSASGTGWRSQTAINWNGLSLVFTGASPVITAGGAFTIANLTVNGTAVKTGSLTVTGPFTVTSTITISTAASSLTNAILVQSNTLGTPRTITCNGSVVINGRVDFMDIAGAGSTSWNLSGSTTGDCGGNSGITFTTAVNRYGVVAGNWSNTTTWSATSGGAGGASVPLPQDNVFLDANSAAGTYTEDMPRACKDLDCTGFTRTLTYDNGLAVDPTTANLPGHIFGNLTLASGMTFTIASGRSILFGGRGSHTITSAGKTFTFTGSRGLGINAPGGTYSIQDALTVTGVSAFRGIRINAGTITATANVTTPLFQAAAGTTVNSGSGTLSMTATGTVWNMDAAATFTAGTSTIAITDTSATSKTFAGGGKVYNNVSITPGGTGAIIFTGSNTFNKITAYNPKTLTLTAGTTQTITMLNVFGAPGSLVTVNSSSGGSAASITMPSGFLETDYVSYQDITATAPKVFYAGANSVSVSGNMNLIFTAPVAKKRLIGSGI
jgi:hypothetical protein